MLLAADSPRLVDLLAGRVARQGRQPHHPTTQHKRKSIASDLSQRSVRAVLLNQIDEDC